MPQVGGRLDFASEHDEQTMTMLGLSSKREMTRTSSRVRTAMAAQTRDQGRYLGGRPPCGYRLGDAGPRSPTRRTPRGGRHAHRLEPDPGTAHLVRWIFAQRLAGRSVARDTADETFANRIARLWPRSDQLVERRPGALCRSLCSMPG
jgi:DNA invertase Pin-like site-specific DNA recombinase